MAFVNLLCKITTQDGSVMLQCGIVMSGRSARGNIFFVIILLSKLSCYYFVMNRILLLHGNSVLFDIPLSHAIITLHLQITMASSLRNMGSN